MPTRSKAEKKRIEKRIRIEKTLVPIVSVVGIALFIVVCALLGKNGVIGGKANETPAPTADPCFTAANALKDAIGGSVTQGDGFSSLAYESSPDGSDATVNYYMKNGVLCTKLVRKLPSVLTDPTPAPTEDMFETVPGNATEAPSTEADDALISTAAEILKALSLVDPGGESSLSEEDIASALKTLADGTATKTSLIFGIYVVEFKYTKADRILTVVCEPA